MKVALLAAASSIHTVRWANGLAARNVEVHLISAHPIAHDLDRRIQLYCLPVRDRKSVV